MKEKIKSFFNDNKSMIAVISLLIGLTVLVFLIRKFS